MKYKIKSSDTKERLDIYLSNVAGETRSHIQALIKRNLVLVNGEVKKSNYKLVLDDIIEVFSDKEVEDIKAEKIDINIIYEDEYLLVVNKQSNMVVHPAPGNYSGTLVNALQYYGKALSDINGEFRPGIVHRIDKNTSGLLIIAKDNKTHTLLSEMISLREVNREYKAIVHGRFLEKEALIKAPIGRNVKDRKKMEVTEKNSKYAETLINVITTNENYSLINCKLRTGRTHQIRVHLKYINHPIVGDYEYGPKNTIDTIGQALHAYKLEFVHPITKEEIKLTAPLPDEFLKTLKEVGLEDINGN